MSPGGVIETVEAFLFVIIIEDTTDIYRLGKGHKELSHIPCDLPISPRQACIHGCEISAYIYSLEQGFPTPRPQTGTGPWPTRIRLHSRR